MLFGEMLGDDAPRGGMGAHIGHRIEPLVELCIEVREIAELAAEEEVLTHVAEQAFNLALGLGAIRAARLGQEAVMAREAEQRAIVDDVTALGVVSSRRAPRCCGSAAMVRSVSNRQSVADGCDAARLNS